MGIVLVPLFLAILLGFLYLGIKSGAQAVATARGRLSAAMFLLTATALFATVELVLPFALLATRTVPAGSVVVYALALGGIAWVAGTSLMKQYRDTQKPVAGLFAAALFLATALFPINWFCWAEQTRVWFHVNWSY